MQSTTDIDAKAMAIEMAELMAAGENDRAAMIWIELQDAIPGVAANPTMPVMLAIRRGRPQDALQLLNSIGEDDWPDLRALSLHAMGDPTWASYALANEDNPDPHVRAAMRRLLERPVEFTPGPGLLAARLA